MLLLLLPELCRGVNYVTAVIGVREAEQNRLFRGERKPFCLRVFAFNAAIPNPEPS